VKNRSKSAEEGKAEHLLNSQSFNCSFRYGAETPAAGTNGGSEAELPAIIAVLSKNTHFYVGLNFCLKCVFK